ncbi:hypothetical protein BKA70DRAFT_1399110 [Coprinopsis sp. MPI-PUGE-AT-0042]|nr:hypothetical protein BKA70DRAFT_1399110 [Coprinopsis sp. MPI-PUGE-AT-0042]
MIGYQAVWISLKYELTDPRSPHRLYSTLGIPPDRKHFIFKDPLSRLWRRLAESVLLNLSKVVDRSKYRYEVEVCCSHPCRGMTYLGLKQLTLGSPSPVDQVSESSYPGSREAPMAVARGSASEAFLAMSTHRRLLKILRLRSRMASAKRSGKRKALSCTINAEAKSRGLRLYAVEKKRDAIPAQKVYKGIHIQQTWRQGQGESRPENLGLSAIKTAIKRLARTKIIFLPSKFSTAWVYIVHHQYTFNTPTTTLTSRAAGDGDVRRLRTCASAATTSILPLVVPLVSPLVTWPPRSSFIKMSQGHEFCKTVDRRATRRRTT